MTNSTVLDSLGRKFRPKKCKACQQKFTPTRPLQEACTPRCALDLVRIKEKKKRRQRDRERLQELQPISHWLTETQRVFNEYIRERDKGENCISCGAPDSTRWDAGPYRSRGAAAHLRFNEDNCWLQCLKCNVHLSGNQVEYRKRLVEKIGEERVLALEHDNEPRKWTREELKQIRTDLKKRIKELKQNNC